MLTKAEPTDAREKLQQANLLIEAVRGAFLGGAYFEGARLLNEVAHLLADEIAVLDKSIEGKKSMRVTIEIEIASGGRLGVLELAAKLTSIAARVLKAPAVQAFKADGVDLSVGYGFSRDLVLEPNGAAYRRLLGGKPGGPITMAEAEAAITRAIKSRDH